MANMCITFLFFSYASASIIYLILGAFAASGNAALLMEHCHRNETNAIEPSELEGVKSRTIGQYFLAAGISVIISVLLYIFCILRKEKGYTIIYPEQSGEKINRIEEDDNEDNSINNTGTMPIELAIDSKKVINNDESSNDNNEEGMKENINT